MAYEWDPVRRVGTGSTPPRDSHETPDGSAVEFLQRGEGVPRQGEVEFGRDRPVFFGDGTDRGPKLAGGPAFAIREFGDSSDCWNGDCFISD